MGPHPAHETVLTAFPCQMCHQSLIVASETESGRGKLGHKKVRGEKQLSKKKWLLKIRILKLERNLEIESKSWQSPQELSAQESYYGSSLWTSPTL